MPTLKFRLAHLQIILVVHNSDQLPATFEAIYRPLLKALGDNARGDFKSSVSAALRSFRRIEKDGIRTIQYDTSSKQYEFV